MRNMLGDAPFKSDDSKPTRGDGKTAAAKALMSAVKSGDASAVVSAFEDMMSLCGMSSEPDYDDEDEE